MDGDEILITELRFNEVIRVGKAIASHIHWSRFSSVRQLWVDTIIPSPHSLLPSFRRVGYRLVLRINPSEAGLIKSPHTPASVEWKVMSPHIRHRPGGREFTTLNYDIVRVYLGDVVQQGLHIDSEMRRRELMGWGMR